MIRSMIFGVALACAASPAAAAVQLDQEAFTVVQAGNSAVIGRVGEIPAPPSRPGPSTIQATVQTFTAGLGGTLSHLEFQAGNFGPLTQNGVLIMSLIDGDYEAGARTVIWQDAIFIGSLPDLAAARGGALGALFDVGQAGYAVSVGQRYSVLFEGHIFQPNQYAGLIVGQGTLPGPTPPVFTGPGYTGGRFIGIINGQLTPSISDFDIGFRSYVDVAAAIPEPATWAMMTLGFGAVGAALRRRAARALARA